jgi:divalent metal cation (Fe/Co/Zn/Cd) transporter
MKSSNQQPYQKLELESCQNHTSNFDELSDINGNSEGHSSAKTISWLVNGILFFAKAVVYILSSSKAVMAALVDSAVDLVSQAILAIAEIYMAKFSPNYPVGRSRLEALSVIACAFIMITASIVGKFLLF